MHGQRQTAFSSFILNRNNGGLLPKAEEQVWMADWKRFRLPYCSLYVVSTDGKWPCKVGISTHAYKRLVQLQTSVWKPLQIVHCYWTASVNEARTLEKAVHSRLTEDNVWLHGEWFNMRPKEAKEMIEFVSLVEGIEIFDKIDNQEVISDMQSFMRGLERNEVYVERINRRRHSNFDSDGLATLAKEYKELGMVVSPALQEMVMDYEYEEEQRRLPSFRNSER